MARRRLIGAALLLVMGVVVFPLLFDHKPRPVSVDLPIEVATARKAPLDAQGPKDGAVPVRPVTPSPAATVTAAAAGSVAAPAVDSAPADPPPASEPVAPVAPVVPASRVETASAAAAPSVPAMPASPVVPASPSVAAAPDTPAAAAPGQVAVERFVVQVGAFADANAVREARQKVERLGLKTYTQVVDTDSGKRTRVRVGPFATRDEALAALARLKTAGLAGNLLIL